MVFDDDDLRGLGKAPRPFRSSVPTDFKFWRPVIRYLTYVNRVPANGARATDPWNLGGGADLSPHQH